MKKIYFLSLLLFVANMGFAQLARINIKSNDGGDQTHYQLEYREAGADDNAWIRVNDI